jgi:hypothetical protein
VKLILKSVIPVGIPVPTKKQEKLTTAIRILAVLVVPSTDAAVAGLNTEPPLKAANLSSKEEYAGVFVVEIVTQMIVVVAVAVK